MGRAILKPWPDRDLYVEWSSNVDNIVGWGTRQQWINDARHWNGETGVQRMLGSLARADETGTSDRVFNTFAWSDTGRHRVDVPADGVAWLPADRLKDYAEAFIERRMVDSRAALIIEPYDG